MLSIANLQGETMKIMHGIGVERVIFFTLIVCTFSGVPTIALAASGPGDVVGKVMCGYQGWFSCQGDGSAIGGWSHYSSSGAPSSSTCLIKSWPDVRDYTTTYQTAFANYGNGQPAKLYSPWDQQSVDTQFYWMQQTGIDGVALQRFGSWTSPGSKSKSQVDGIATRVKNAAEKYGRKFYVMYDGHSTDALQADWTNTIVGTLHLTSSPAYAMQNGKPVVCLWGVGKSDRGTTSGWMDMINGFKSLGCYVIGGPLAGWRTDTPNLPAYNLCDMITPWMVGAIGNIAGADNQYNRAVQDIAYCKSLGIDYQQGVIPGDLQLHQRVHGDLMWREFYNAVRAGTQGIYIAMFDEYNEGNQIAKTAESASMIPVGSSFLGLDEDGTACSSDYYLRLTGDGGRMLKGQISLTATRPTQPMGGTGVYQDPAPNLSMTASPVKVLPLRNGARIDYSAPFENNVVDMRIFTSTGRIVWQYHAVQSGKGLHSVDWAAANNAPGTYIVKMSVTNRSGSEFIASSNRCILFPR
jgi:hypothetical protein